jgi:hypothetical protein
MDYELGHLQVARELFESPERRDAVELLPQRLPEPIQYPPAAPADSLMA